MSHLLRLKRSLVFLIDINRRASLNEILLRERGDITTCPKHTSLQCVSGKCYSGTPTLLSNGSARVKFTATRAGRPKWKKRKSAISKVKVERDLFSVLNMRTTQLALGAMMQEEGETTKDSPDAILVVPRSLKFLRETQNLELSKPFPYRKKQSKKFHGDRTGVSHRERSPDVDREYQGEEHWRSSFEVFQNQFFMKRKEQDVSQSLSEDRSEAFLHSRDRKHKDPHKPPHPGPPILQEYGSEKTDKKHHERGASELDSFRSSLSGTEDAESFAKYTDFVDEDGMMFRGSHVRDELESFPDIPEEILDAVIARHISEHEYDEHSEAQDIKRVTGAEKLHKQLLGERDPTVTKHSAASSAPKTGKKLEYGSPFANVSALRTKSLNPDVKHYMEACFAAGMLDQAHSAILYYQFMMKSNPTNPAMQHILDIDTYNLMISAWAKQGNMAKIKDLFAFIKKDGLEPTLQTYVACLECLYHQKDLDMALCRSIIDDLETQGLELENILNECKLKKEEFDAVMQVVLQVRQGFTPRPRPDFEPYNGPLLEPLNQPSDQVVEHNPYAGVVSPDRFSRQIGAQLERELKGTVTVKSIASRPNVTKKMKDYRKKLDAVRSLWRDMFKKGLDKKIRYLTRKSKGTHGVSLLPYLRLLPPDEYVDCVFTEMDKIAMFAESFSPSMGILSKQLGYSIYNSFIRHQNTKSRADQKIAQLYRQYAKYYNDKDFPFSNHRECWHHIITKEGMWSALDVPTKPWPDHIMKAIGKTLFDVILYDMKIDSNLFRNTNERKMVPAFYSVYRTYGHRMIEELKPNPTLVRIYQGADLDEMTFDTSDLPMLVPPIPWVSMNHGGFLLGSVQLVRRPDHLSRHSDRLQNTPVSKIQAVLDSLNNLGACAWIINKPMLDLITDIFKNKGNQDLDIPPPVSECPPMPKLTQNMSPQEKSKIFMERMKIRQQRSEAHGLWCTELYKLSISNQFRDEMFWFPHNMDFRGRTYPCPPHLNHLGSDVARSILLFAKGKPLGDHGLDWLKIHLINLTGFKKRSSNKDRLAYANEMMPEILDSADNPMTGNKWWQGSDEGWQTLACCKEIANIVRSPDPAQYICHLPVHQDGSCNGLQHYAALGRDQSGAESVNLCPFDEPRDVYSDVAELVEQVRQRDAAEGHEIAKLLEGFVRRKVIKQTVMTTVYGVTKYGAKYQIQRKLKDIPEFPQEEVWKASSYLTEKTFQCLREKFTATREIQDWLTLSAQLISTIRHKPVEWVTPMGLLVIQPYHKQLTFSRLGMNIIDSCINENKPNSVKQKNAFPPNFIHSLDSSHMMLTSLYCLRAGITYVSVHDCYWTHPADVEIMNKICREQFVALHEQPVLEDLCQYLLQMFSRDGGSDCEPEIAETFLNSVLAEVPSRGTFDLRSVLKSVYFFS
ncbi:DNA-directed RNA polymerase, mitochondrial-like [Haliotis rufescens]|uniref:DNA-directed RNA polymerase, mitochondrial-like n=1 Tax=Haliotis rufescens TaxID=6454 RepID=UPI00201EDE81|nr:DNA-directed RNA polymerase, mitochondrial-like [Haliotis rufescens]